MESHHIARITKYSHHFTVSDFRFSVKPILIAYTRTLGQYGLVKRGRGKFVNGIVKVYAASTQQRDNFRFHINTYNDFISFLTNNGIRGKQLFIEVIPLFEPAEINCDFIDSRKLRDHQIPVSKYVVDGLISKEDGTNKTKLVTLDPGQGKTFISLFSINEINYRTIFIMRAQYIEQWINQLHVAYDVDVEDILVIKGLNSVKTFLDMCVSGELNASFILISTQTYRMFIKQYETLGKQLKEYGYSLFPQEVFSAGKIGLRVIDEVHQDFHFNFKLDLYTHIPLTLSLSGSIDNDDPAVTRFTETMFPSHTRYKKVASKVYVSAVALLYSIENVDERVKYINHVLKVYSHVKFEESIMRRKKLQDEYFSMIYEIIIERHIDVAEDGQKIIIFMSTVEMCTKFSNYLKERITNKKVQRYVSEDDYETMLKSDIIVSTLKSLGTAIHVPDLLTVLLTEAISSSQSNIQCFGRLRDLVDWEDSTPEFIFLVCESISKHIKYYRIKKDILSSRVKSFKTIRTDYVL